MMCLILDLHHNLQITDATILDKQNVHKTLYRLWEDEYIDLEVCCIISTKIFHRACVVISHFFSWS
jgi:hypothetical protein